MRHRLARGWHLLGTGSVDPRIARKRILWIHHGPPPPYGTSDAAVDDSRIVLRKKSTPQLEQASYPRRVWLGRVRAGSARRATRVSERAALAINRATGWRRHEAPGPLDRWSGQRVLLQRIGTFASRAASRSIPKRFRCRSNHYYLQASVRTDPSVVPGEAAT